MLSGILCPGGVRHLWQGEKQEEIGGNMRKQLWKMLALTLAFTCTMASPLAAVSAAQGSGWLQENGSWRYYSAGIAQTGWLHLDDKWYYLARKQEIWRQDGTGAQTAAGIILNPEAARCSMAG